MEEDWHNYMMISIRTNDQTYEIDNGSPLDISIPLRFDGPQPNAYGVPQATSNPCQAGELAGDTRQGGPCNFEQYSFIPHCNGTHTECVGHITKNRISVRDCLTDVFIPATLVSLKPEWAGEMIDNYLPEPDETDLLITRRAIQNSKLEIENPESSGLIIRTLPNDSSKLTKEYGEYVPPYFSNEAIEFIVESGFKHLLVDLPSIDRVFDDGRLSNHRLFWNVKAGEFKTNENSRINNTITELIYVPEKIKDGNYLLNLQIAAFEADTSPSRPILFSFLN